jgi:hypothetical protein
MRTPQSPPALGGGLLILDNMAIFDYRTGKVKLATVKNSHENLYCTIQILASGVSKNGGFLRLNSSVILGRKFNLMILGS